VNYEVEIGGRLRRAVVHRAGGQFVVEIDGQPSTVDAERIDAQTLSLLIDGKSFDVIVTPESGGAGQLAVNVGATSVAVSLNGRRRWGRRDASADAGAGPQRIVAPMPGKIVRVLVAPQAAVQARQPIVVIEAMKMENELRAVRDGIVAELHAVEGQSVEAGAVLAVITPVV
jgi:biotin carboxyl carrier protein